MTPPLPPLAKVPARRYSRTLMDVDQAVRSMPGNPDVHAFRALIYFAMGDYERAAAVAHDLLEAGPGWEWQILESLYPTSDVYTQQLRALEHYVGEHPKSAAPRFLLAYHYLVLGHLSAADRQLAQVVTLEPRDKLAAAVLATIKQGPNAVAQTAQPQPGARNWAPRQSPQARRSIQSSSSERGKRRRRFEVKVEAKLEPDGHFVWTVTHEGQSQNFNGTYAVQNDSLVMTRTDGQKMDGNVTLKGTNAFSFKLKTHWPKTGLAVLEVMRLKLLVRPRSM